MTTERLPHDGIEREILLPKEMVSQRIKELGEQISKDYKGKKPVLVGVLNGSFIFAADLIRELDPDLKTQMEFIKVSSYGNKQATSKQPEIESGVKRIARRHIIVVEDIIDSGYSMNALIPLLKEKKPASLKVCALISKPDARQVEVPIDYVGFSIPDKWIEGCGMDTKGKNRGLPDIVCRKC